jgi:hypothetical protein
LPSATPAAPLAGLPFTSTLEDSATLLILPLLIIAFAVLYLVARAQRRRARPVI